MEVLIGLVFTHKLIAPVSTRPCVAMVARFLLFVEFAEAYEFCLTISCLYEVMEDIICLKCGTLQSYSVLFSHI